MFVIEVAIAGETVDGITDLFDSMPNVDTFQFHEDAGVLLRVRGMMTKKIVTLIVSGVSVKMPVNLVFVNNSGSRLTTVNLLLRSCTVKREVQLHFDASRRTRKSSVDLHDGFWSKHLQLIIDGK